MQGRPVGRACRHLGSIREIFRQLEHNSHENTHDTMCFVIVMQILRHFYLEELLPGRYLPPLQSPERRRNIYEQRFLQFLVLIIIFFSMIIIIILFIMSAQTAVLATEKQI